MDPSHHLDDLTDAIARGRLALAEVAAIPPRELDAMFELAAQCLDAGRNAQAVAILGGLVALFPFSARFWRASAVALHRQLDLDRARAAYEAALALEPGHELTRCYRAEVLIYLGETSVARRELEALLGAGDRQVQSRARELLQRLPDLARFKGCAPPAARPRAVGPGADLPRFTIGGTRELPLLETQFMDGDDTLELMKPEVTSTARIFAQFLDEPTAPFDEPKEPTFTETAIIRHRKTAAAPVVPSTPDITDTGIVGGRGRAHPKPAPPSEHKSTAPLVRAEKSHTAIVMRRAHQPLVGDDAPASPESTAVDGETPNEGGES